MRGGDPTRALLLLALAACAAEGEAPADADPDAVAPADPPVVIDPLALCDGTPDVKIRFAYYDGETPYASEPMMAKQGNRYIVVDGTCTFYAYDDGKYPLYAWSPVVSGQLAPDEMVALAADLGVDAWANATSASLEDPDGYTMHVSPLVFFVDGRYAECFQCTNEAVLMFRRAEDAIQALYLTAAPYVSPTLEALVFAPPPADAEPDWAAAWGASAPPETFIGVRGLERYADLGVVVPEADRAWFAAVQAGFQERDIATWPRRQAGIDIVADPETAAPAEWELFVRSIVPGPSGRPPAAGY